MAEPANVKRVRNAGLLLLVLGVVVLFVLRTRGIRYFGPVPTIILVWIPLLGWTAAENWAMHASRSRWLGWCFGAAIMIGLTIYLRA